MIQWIDANKDWIGIVINFFVALGTIGAVVTSLFLAFRKKPFYRIENKKYNHIFGKLCFDLYNCNDTPMIVNNIYSEPNLLIYKNGWASINTEIGFKTISNVGLKVRFQRFEQRITQTGGNSGVPKDAILAHSFVTYELDIKDIIRKIKDGNDKQIGILKQNKIIIITNFGKIVLSYPHKPWFYSYMKKYFNRFLKKDLR